MMPMYVWVCCVYIAIEIYINIYMITSPIICLHFAKAYQVSWFFFVWEWKRICQPFNVQIGEKNKSIKNIAGRIMNNDRYYIGQYMFDKLVDLHKWKWPQQKIQYSEFLIGIQMAGKSSKTSWSMTVFKLSPKESLMHLLYFSLFSERNLIVLGPLLLDSTSFYASQEFPNPV